ncbi:LOB domain-containing protein CRL1-like [Typha angustifolia]|uniref:LOB domain-containing protein CRL1-like n=1 Tax=Typha angustifolia TaxID=59011 RepID=UPI003C2FC512
MTGLGSPCGACKFLRRKCVRGCVFAPYFCHEQGASHFAAIHKVFGASNVSKLLMHLPVSDRSEAAVTISYEAQARLQDPIYGCVSHIFALQQQVVSLQAQLASLKAQAAQGHGNDSTTNKAPHYQQDGLHSLFPKVDGRITPPMLPNSLGHTDDMSNYYSSGSSESNCMQSSQGYNPYSIMADEHLSLDVGGDNSSFGAASLEMQGGNWRYQDMEDLESVAYAYLHRS